MTAAPAATYENNCLKIINKKKNCWFPSLRSTAHSHKQSDSNQLGRLETKIVCAFSIQSTTSIPDILRPFHVMSAILRLIYFIFIDIVLLCRNVVDDHFSVPLWLRFVFAILLIENGKEECRRGERAMCHALDWTRISIKMYLHSLSVRQKQTFDAYIGALL